MNSQLRVLNISHVRPVQTAGLSPRRQGEQELSFLDLLQISKIIQRLFFFDGPDLPPFPSVVSALRSSLAATLAVFLPLAGELAFRPDSGDVVIDFSPAAISSSPGVKFVEAEFAGGADGMRRLARDEAHDTEAFARLVPELEAGSLPAPVLAVQVTRPADGGAAVAVGVSIRHAVADGHAVWQFLRAWSTASREGPGSLAAPGFVQPTFDRAGIRHPKSAEIGRSILSKVAPALPLVVLLLDESRQVILEQFLLDQRCRDPVPEAAHPRTEQSTQPRRAVQAAEHLRRRLVPGVDVHRPGEPHHARRRRRPPHGQRGLSQPPAPAARRRLLRDLRQGVLRAGPRGRPARRGRRRARRRGHPGRDPRVPGGARGRPAVGRRGLGGGVRRRPEGEACDIGVVEPVRGVRDGLRVGRAEPRRAGVPVRDANGDAARREGRRRAGVDGARRGGDGCLRGQLRRSRSGFGG